MSLMRKSKENGNDESLSNAVWRLSKAHPTALQGSGNHASPRAVATEGRRRHFQGRIRQNRARGEKREASLGRGGRPAAAPSCRQSAGSSAPLQTTAVLAGLAPGLSSRLRALDRGQAIHGLQHKRLPRPRGPQSPRPRPYHPKPPRPREPPEAMGTLAALRELPTAADALDPTAVL